jgi:hypothetical protein
MAERALSLHNEFAFHRPLDLGLRRLGARDARRKQAEDENEKTIEAEIAG